MGRRADPHVPEAVHAGRTSAPGSTARRENLGVDTLDLVQLHCPPTARLLHRRGLRRARRARRRGRHRRVRRVSVETRRRGADRDRPAGRGERADHPQRLPPQAAGAGAARGRRGRRRHHRAGAAGQRPAVRQVRRATPRSPPTTTATSTGTARRSTSARRSPGCRFEVGVRGRASGSRCSRRHGATTAAARAALDHRPAGRERRDPRRAQRRAGARQRRGRRAAAARARTCSPPCARVYDELIRPHVHDRW